MVIFSFLVLAHLVWSANRRGLTFFLLSFLIFNCASPFYRLCFVHVPHFVRCVNFIMLSSSFLEGIFLFHFYLFFRFNFVNRILIHMLRRSHILFVVYVAFHFKFILFQMFFLLAFSINFCSLFLFCSRYGRLKFSYILCHSVHFVFCFSQ